MDKRFAATFRVTRGGFNYEVELVTLEVTNRSGALVTAPARTKRLIGTDIGGLYDVGYEHLGGSNRPKTDSVITVSGTLQNSGFANLPSFLGERIEVNGRKVAGRNLRELGLGA